MRRREKRWLRKLLKWLTHSERHENGCHSALEYALISDHELISALKKRLGVIAERIFQKIRPLMDLKNISEQFQIFQTKGLCLEMSLHYLATRKHSGR